jgi:ribosomal protein S12 methylthiotransferase
VDLTGRLELPSLLEKLDRVPGLEWIRVLYAYPAFLTDEMMAAMASLGKVVKYLDLPLQHISDKMLRRMGRRLDGARTRSLLEKLRGRIPGIYLRTTFLVGFPGEDEREFGLLRDFVRDFRFERLGVFAFSEEEGTAAATFAGRVPTEVRARRAEEILLVQRENAFRHNRGRKGESVRVLVDEVRAGRKGRPPMLRARSAGEAPEIDPCVLVHAEPACGVPSTAKGPLPAGGAAPGDFLLVTITGSRGYDLLSSPAKSASKGDALPLS